MLIRTLTRAAGRLCFDSGQEIDLPESDAIELIAAGAALRVGGEPTVTLHALTAETAETVSDPPKPSTRKKG